MQASGKPGRLPANCKSINPLSLLPLSRRVSSQKMRVLPVALAAVLALAGAAAAAGIGDLTGALSWRWGRTLKQTRKPHPVG